MRVWKQKIEIASEGQTVCVDWLWLGGSKLEIVIMKSRHPEKCGANEKNTVCITGSQLNKNLYAYNLPTG